MTRDVAASALVVAIALGVAGCQQPLLCGAQGEPCCDGECHPALACAAGTCGLAACAALRGCDWRSDAACGEGRSCRLSLDATGFFGECRSEARGGAALGGTCADEIDCAAGLHCDPSTARCVATCCGDLDCPDAGSCIGAPGFCAGDDGCDYFTGRGCSLGYGCTGVLLRDGREAPQCLTAGDRIAGEECEARSDCAVGLTCIGTGDGSGLCAPLCDALHPCASGDCLPIEGWSSYGFCG